MGRSASKDHRGRVLGPSALVERIVVAVLLGVVVTCLVVISISLLTYTHGRTAAAVVIRADPKFGRRPIDVWFEYQADGRDVRDKDQVLSGYAVRAGDRLEVRYLALGPLRNALIAQGHNWGKLVVPSVAVLVFGLPAWGSLLNSRRARAARRDSMVADGRNADNPPMQRTATASSGPVE